MYPLRLIPQIMYWWHLHFKDWFVNHKMVKNEENYGMGQTSKGNLDKQIKKPTSDNLEKLMNVDILEKPVNTIVKMIQTK